MSGTQRPPAPDGLPVLGHGMTFARDPWSALREWSEEGDVVRLSFPGREMYLVSDPDLVEQVLVSESSRFTISTAQRETFDGIEDDAVTVTEGDRWQRLRRALQPAFTWEGIRDYGDRMAEQAAAHVDRWDDGDELALLDEMRLLTRHVLADTLLGVDVAGDEARVHEAADALADADPGEDTVAGVLLAARERGDLSTAELEDNHTALLLAGHDSSALALTYAWYELSRHPEVRERLAAQAADVLGGDLPDAEDFEALERTRDVVRETLRLYPPAFATTRETTEPVTLGGYELPAGTQVMCSQWVLHRDGRFWDEPDSFDPGRWERDTDRPEYAYFPFSGGPRHCIGMRFARLELVLALATMVDRVDLDVAVDGPLTFTPTISLRPENDVTATVRRL